MRRRMTAGSTDQNRQEQTNAEKRAEKLRHRAPTWERTTLQWVSGRSGAAPRWPAASLDEGIERGAKPAEGGLHRGRGREIRSVHDLQQPLQILAKPRKIVLPFAARGWRIEILLFTHQGVEFC